MEQQEQPRIRRKKRLRNHSLELGSKPFSQPCEPSFCRSNRTSWRKDHNSRSKELVRSIQELEHNIQELVRNMELVRSRQELERSMLKRDGCPSC
jgi:queuine/archaeosine tRNA-ribosyltransferase